MVTDIEMFESANTKALYNSIYYVYSLDTTFLYITKGERFRS